jgi:hypothetical protein
MADIHTRLYAACLIYSLAVGGWSFFNAFKGRSLDSNFWGSLVINELVFVAAGLFDIVLLLNGGILPGRPAVHLLYTATGVLTIPLVYTLTQGKNTSREAAFYGTACLWLAGIALRAIITTVV